MATTQVIRSERFPDLADEVFFPRLSDAKLAWLGKRGRRRTVAPAEVLYEHAVRDAPFFVIERGLRWLGGAEDVRGRGVAPGGQAGTSTRAERRAATATYRGH
jgi:hypothetical protein